MNLFRVILSWLSIAAGTWLAVAFAVNPAKDPGWGAWAGVGSFAGALFLSGVLMLLRKTAGRYLFSLCLTFAMFVGLVVLNFFSEPLVLSASLSASQANPVSLGDRVRILWESAPDNFMSLLAVFALLAGSTCLFILVHSPRFKESFKK